MPFPQIGCCLMTSHSLRVSDEDLSNIDVGTNTFPISCRNTPLPAFAMVLGLTVKPRPFVRPSYRREYCDDRLSNLVAIMCAANPPQYVDSMGCPSIQDNVDSTHIVL